MQNRGTQRGAAKILHGYSQLKYRKIEARRAKDAEKKNRESTISPQLPADALKSQMKYKRRVLVTSTSTEVGRVYL